MLDPLTNPYSPGAGSPPPALVGRDVEREEFDVAAQRLLRGRSDRSQLLVGLRGVGKTVLLREFGRIGQRRGWRNHHLECVEETDFVQAAAHLARAAILDLSLGTRLSELGSRALGVLKAFQLTWEIPGGGTASMGFDSDPIPGRADSGDLDRDLTDLLREVGHLARSKDTGVLFTIDEIQHISASRLRPLLLGLHEMSQLQLPLLVAGAGLPSVRGLLGEARTYAERLFTFVSMDSLSREAASEALVQPAAREGVHWEGAALEGPSITREAGRGPLSTRCSGQPTAIRTSCRSSASRLGVWRRVLIASLVKMCCTRCRASCTNSMRASSASGWVGRRRRSASISGPWRRRAAAPIDRARWRECCTGPRSSCRAAMTAGPESAAQVHAAGVDRAGFSDQARSVLRTRTRQDRFHGAHVR